MTTSLSFSATEVSINGVSRNQVYVNADVDNNGIDEILSGIDEDKIVEWLESAGYTVSQND